MVQVMTANHLQDRRRRGFTLVELPVVRKRNRAAFTLVELLVVIAIIGILVALLLPAIQAAREAARRSQCQANIHNVALAVLNFESAQKTLPAGMTFDAKQGGSIQTLTKYGPNWIISVLPYMEEQAVRDAFDPKVFQKFQVAVNDPGTNNVNVTARGTTIPVLLCPSDPFNKVPYKGHGGNWGRTDYAANAGRAFIYGAVQAAENPNPPPTYMSGPDAPGNNAGWTDACQRGVMGPNESVKLKGIADGTSKTFMVGEIRAGMTEGDGRGVWALGHAGPSLLAMYGSGGDDQGPNQPDYRADDVVSDVCSTGSGLCQTSPPPNGLTQPENMNCSGGGTFDQQTMRSKHPGGVQAAFCDGSVQFISDDVESSGCPGTCCTAWDYMITSADQGKLGNYNGAPSGRGAAAPCN